MTQQVPVVAEDVPPEEARALLDRVARGLVVRRLTSPAVFALEMCKPLNFIGSQAMLALQPFVAAFVDADAYRKLALVLERDDNVEVLIQRIEVLDREERALQEPTSSVLLERLRRRFRRAKDDENQDG